MTATAGAALRASAAFWLMAALAGQWAFLYYIAAFYGRSTLTGNFEIWNRLQALGRTPYLPGDTAGNAAFAAHALGAGIVAFGGALQLIPQIRTRAPRFHRWNGRIFMLTVVALAGGLVVLALLLAVGAVGFGAFTQMNISGEPLGF